jgi:hypothetical protein
MPGTKKTNKIKVSWVNKQLNGIQEALFYDECYFPKMKHLMHIAKKWGIFREEDLTTWNLGYNETMEIDWPIDNDLQDELSSRLQPYFQHTYEMDYCEDVSEEEMLSLGIAPPYTIQMRLL